MKNKLININSKYIRIINIAKNSTMEVVCLGRLDIKLLHSKKLLIDKTLQHSKEICYKQNMFIP